MDPNREPQTSRRTSPTHVFWVLFFAFLCLISFDDRMRLGAVDSLLRAGTALVQLGIVGIKHANGKLDGISAANGTLDVGLYCNKYRDMQCLCGFATNIS